MRCVSIAAPTSRLPILPVLTSRARQEAANRVLATPAIEFLEGRVPAFAAALPFHVRSATMKPLLPMKASWPRKKAADMLTVTMLRIRADSFIVTVHEQKVLQKETKPTKICGAVFWENHGYCQSSRIGLTKLFVPSVSFCKIPCLFCFREQLPFI